MNVEYALPPATAAFVARKMAEIAGLRQRRFALLGQVHETERAADEAQRSIEAHLNVVRETADLPDLTYTVSQDGKKLVASMPDAPAPAPAPAPTQEPDHADDHANAEEN